MVPCLRAFVALVEDQGLVPRIPMALYNCGVTDISNASSDLHGLLYSRGVCNIHPGKLLMYIK